MPRVQYVGTSHYREFTAADWKNVGVEDQDKVVFDRDNRGGDGVHSGRSLAQVHEVSEAAAQYLMEKEPKGDFKLIEDEPADPAALSQEPTDASPESQTTEGSNPGAVPGLSSPTGRTRST